MPLFSIIVVHYQGVIPHDIFCRGVASLKAQTLTDYEILCYHDGPLLDATLPMPLAVICTERRHDDWGHSLRDRGMREARGEYILHFNADNVLFADALAEIKKEIDRPPRLLVEGGPPLDANDIIIFPVRMMGIQQRHGHNFRFMGPRDFYTIFTGNPPIVDNIDAMQLVMRRSLWVAEGGWRDKRANGDGHMYEAFCKKYGYRTVGPVIGEHH